MNILNKRNLAIAIAAFIIGTLAVFVGARSLDAAGGLQKAFNADTSVKGQVTSFILDDAGAVTGLVLASGDQLRFGRTLGESVASAVKVGDEVSATGNAGTRSEQGREVRVKRLTANDRTFVEAAPTHKPHHPKPHGRGKHRGPKPPAPDMQAGQPGQPATPQTAPPAPDLNGAQTTPPAPAAPPAPEMIAGAILVPQMTATGTVRTYLVGKRGEINGAILASGEQFRFPPKVGELVTTAMGGTPKTDVQMSVEGSAVQTERGTVIRARRLTIGNQTFALGR